MTVVLMTNSRHDTPSLDVLRERIEQVYDKDEDGHKRLREDWRGHDARLEVLENRCSTICGRIAKVEQQQQQPVNIESLAISPRFGLYILGATLTILLSGMAGTYAVKSDMREIGSQLSARARLDDERQATLKDAIDQLRRRQELTELEVRNLADGKGKRNGR